MTTMKTEELSGSALLWAVASIEYPNDTIVTNPEIMPLYGVEALEYLSMQDDIINREGIYLWSPPPPQPPERAWIARHRDALTQSVYGRTFKEAAMRCWVLQKRGRRVNIPAQLIALN